MGEQQKSGRLRWKKQAPETGLRHAFAGPRNSDLHDGVTRFATVYCMHRLRGGWYWVTGWGSGVPHKNTCDEPAPTEQKAKDQAMAYVLAALTKKETP